jgi:type VI secretion system protein VasI
MGWFYYYFYRRHMHQLQRKGWSALAVSFLGVGVAMGAGPIESQLRDCQRIEDSVKRLACFDLVAESTAPKATVVPPSQIPLNWMITTDVSKIDDSATVQVSTTSTNEIEGRYGHQVSLRLMLRCKENKTDVFVHFGGHYMAGLYDVTSVTYRIDRKPAIEANFTESTNNESLFAPQPIPFIKALLGASALTIRAAPYNENSITADFNVSDLETAIKPLREACRW